MLFKDNNKQEFKDNNKHYKKSGTCLKLTIKSPERSKWHRLGNLLLTLNIFHTFSSVSTVDFTQIIVNWGFCQHNQLICWLFDGDNFY